MIAQEWLDIACDTVLESDDSWAVSTLVSQRGAPCWYLRSARGREYKLRLTDTIADARRMARFCAEVQRIDWRFTPTLRLQTARMVITDWARGSTIQRIPPDARRVVLGRVGHALAELHARTKWVVCAADDYNTVVDDSLEPHFVDLEGVHVGPAATDLFWCEELLCHNDLEFESLLTAYRDSGGRSVEDHRGREIFLQHLHRELTRGRFRHPGDSGIKSDLRLVESALNGHHDGRLFRQ